ncbi:MAG: bifunctional DNA primase/polymerase [Phenylobacterium sp.]|nr:bifunctional DNA primase/polymerase [Phenylobacterium sp.]
MRRLPAPGSAAELASTYRSYGVCIIPVREADGAGGQAKSPYVQGGFKNATTDAEQVGRWWWAWPSAAIGLPCRANGIIVLDADRHGSGDGVAEALAIFERCGVDPNAGPVVVTPRDGRHFIFRRPESLGATNGKVAPAIDVRDNAYVIAAGSVMATGRPYALHVGTVPQLATAIATHSLPALPQALCDLIAKPVSSARVQSARSSVERQPVSGGQNDTDPRPRLAGLIRAVATARPGHRNATLHWAACRAGELVSAGLLPSAIAVAALVEAGLMAGLGERETAATVRSGISTAARGSGHGR